MRRAREGAVDALSWLPDEATALLDAGCNVGALLAEARRRHPNLRLAGVDVHETAVATARSAVPTADLCVASVDALPYDDGAFDCVTCLQVLEHVEATRRSAALRELHRVLRPGGRAVISVPHAGWFAWLDPNNFRFRAPRLYRRVVGGGLRDEGYAGGAEDVVWHHHFTLDELLELAGPGWRLTGVRHGGLVLVPLMDIARWPLYRAGRFDSGVADRLRRISQWELGRDFGRASYDLLATFDRR